MTYHLVREFDGPFLCGAERDGLWTYREDVADCVPCLRRAIAASSPPPARTAPSEVEALLAELARLEKEATPAPWEWWTSCSFRRLSHSGDGDVLYATTQRSDGHPDVVCKEADRALIVAMRNALPALLAAYRPPDAEVLADVLRAIRPFAHNEASWGPCEGCDPGGEGQEVWSELLAKIDAALAAYRAAGGTKT